MRLKLREIGLGLALTVAVVPAQESVWSLGLRTQGYVDFEPGNDYMSGFDVGFSHRQLFSHRMELQAEYLTSRIEAAFREILREDWLLFSPVWHFRRDRFFDPTLQLDMGYWRYDIENEAIFGKLDNDSWVYGGKAGFRLNFFRSRYNFHYAIGYQAATSESNKIFPLPFSVGVAVLFL